MDVEVLKGYEPLAEVLIKALRQSDSGKGRDRHATTGKPFTSQPICEIGRMVGIGYNVGQAMKKGQEAMRLPTERAQAELLGAIVYMASAYLLLGEGDGSAEGCDQGALPVCVNKMCKCYNESATSHCIGPFTDPKDCPEHIFDSK